LKLRLITPESVISIAAENTSKQNIFGGTSQTEVTGPSRMTDEAKAVPAGITKIRFARKGLKNLVISLVSSMTNTAIRKASHSSDMFVRLVKLISIP